MKTKAFISNRTHENVVIVMTDKNIEYITENGDIKIKRDFTYHFNDDGMFRCQELFDDPRFEYWLKNNEL